MRVADPCPHLPRKRFLISDPHHTDPVEAGLDGHPLGLAELLRVSARRLAAAGVPDPQVDAELLIASVLDVSRGRLHALAILNGPCPDQLIDRVEPLIVRRENREPLQHITGTAPFRGLTLRVGPGVFIPRPETESVVQFAIDALRSVPTARPLGVDLGTGSGAIALAMATEVPTAHIVAVEKSPEAHRWASANFAAVAATNAELIRGDLATAVGHLAGQVNVLVSNPPYIPAAAIPRDLEVRLYDPEMALYGGVDGLDVVREISRLGRTLVVPGGVLVLEHAEMQGAAIRELLRADGWRSPETHHDLTARDRTTTATR
ncbi:release factor glutamine methyltransferase [Klugiella xanthotipulae]|uniref:Release factor glutamine methyltransferase n=1 Tax=Klugiella xanthotipulae TaxID=244735 RepID=A0A543HY51_9MICO|nr:release factor glutamine methyltransferase [Klugiella xanthotipulae]